MTEWQTFLQTTYFPDLWRDGLWKGRWDDGEWEMDQRCPDCGKKGKLVRLPKPAHGCAWQLQGLVVAYDPDEGEEDRSRYHLAYCGLICQKCLNARRTKKAKERKNPPPERPPFDYGSGGTTCTSLSF